ncbi:MAG: thiamine pyrophosphate-binding protein [Flavobacteriales bacterium]|nr:thiamine pyrophosphate-binding protein [Flavobacteriales bacterium]
MKNYSDEKNVLIIISLLKANGIRKVVASPGTTNVALVASMQTDSYFQMYSAVDERGAAYMACGLAAESGESVVITCTGATASRNYLSGLTEAYYRKLPVLAITSTQPIRSVGHHIAQVIDRSSIQKDVARISVNLPVVKDDDDFWECEVKVNKAIGELTRHGGGPAHINLPTTYNKSFSTKELPLVRTIKRITKNDKFPSIDGAKIAILIGAHPKWTDSQTKALDKFCDLNNAAVFCEHSSNYRGKYWIQTCLLTGQNYEAFSNVIPDLIIDIGEINGETYNGKIVKNKVWRVSLDGEIRDRYKKMEYVFEMSEQTFFEHYSIKETKKENTYFNDIKTLTDDLIKKIPELPFSNIWTASQLAPKIPAASVIHFGILNSLRSWNFFKIPSSVLSDSNSGGYGIDGCLSSLIGASLIEPKKLFYGIIGDLAFFYDMNSIGNRHIGNNLRILLINNGKGTEFRQFMNMAYSLGDETDEYISAGGHFGNKSNYLVKNYAQGLGFDYISASNKEEFEVVHKKFIDDEPTKKSIIFEVFTNNVNENDALLKLVSIQSDNLGGAKSAVKQILGEKGISFLKKVIKK